MTYGSIFRDLFAFQLTLLCLLFSWMVSLIIVGVDSNSVIMLPTQWYRQDLITKDIFSAQTLLQLGKETTYITISTTYPTELRWIWHIYTHVQTKMKQNA